MRRQALTVAMACLLVLAGCTVGYQGDTADRIGWEAGYAATDPLDVVATDGFNASERAAITARTMARVETIRGLEFTEPVPVEIVSRAAYRNRSIRFAGSDQVDIVAEQSWEAPFVLGEDRTAATALDALFGDGVVGYYSSDTGEIVLVSDSPTPTLDRATLAHELVHALQDQQLPDTEPATSRDGRLASQALSEGAARAVERAYETACRERWSCLDRPRGGRPPAGAIATYQGVYLTLIQPYVSGPAFVETLRAREEGWTAVDEAYERVPTTTAETIHPGRYPATATANATVTDRSTPGWSAVGTNRLGETTIHVMFWLERMVPRPDDAIRTSYEHPLSAGLAGDRLVAYESATGQQGYVWRTVWDSPAEAREFHDGYLRLLRFRVGADRLAPAAEGPSKRYVVRSGPYADAFRVRLDGDTVTIVNAPSVDELEKIHAASR